MTRVLLTTTSFQDTPGVHHDLLVAAGFEIVRERGPLSETRMLELAGQFDAYLCGDDALTRAVIGCEAVFEVEAAAFTFFHVGSLACRKVLTHHCAIVRHHNQTKGVGPDQSCPLIARTTCMPSKTRVHRQRYRSTSVKV